MKTTITTIYYNSRIIIALTSGGSSCFFGGSLNVKIISWTRGCDLTKALLNGWNKLFSILFFPVWYCLKCTKGNSYYSDQTFYLFLSVFPTQPILYPQIDVMSTNSIINELDKKLQLSKHYRFVISWQVKTGNFVVWVGKTFK